MLKEAKMPRKKRRSQKTDSKEVGAERTRAKPSKRAAKTKGIGEHQTSFVLRLTLDDRNTLRRSEIEHAQSGRKQAFASLDADSVIGFIRSCVGLEENQPAAAPKPLVIEPVPPSNPPKLALRSVELQWTGVADPNATLSAQPTGKPLEAQVRFSLEGSEATVLSGEVGKYTIKIYCSNLERGSSLLLCQHTDHLEPDRLEYQLPLEVPELAPGSYRMLTLVRVEGPEKAIGYQEGTLQVVSSYPINLAPGMASGQVSSVSGSL